MDLQLFRVLFNASIFKTGDKRRPMDNTLEHFTQKERNWLRYATLIKKKESGSETFLFSARSDTETSRFRYFSFFIFPHQWGNSTFPLWRAFFKKLRFSECLILIWVISVDGRLIHKKRCFFKEPKKASALAGLDTCVRGLMFLMSLFFARVECTVCTLHLQHKFFVKGKNSTFYPAFWISSLFETS